MKKILTFVVFSAFLFVSNTILSQETVSKNYFQIAPRIGYDFPTYNNSTPYIDYKGGLMFGISLDYYWNWIGLGADFDYLKNQPQSTFPTTNLVNTNSVLLTDFNLTENSIIRTFYGIGPSFKYQTKTGKITGELSLRAGFGSINGGKTELIETTTANSQLLNFHDGYDVNSVFSAKSQLRITYYFTRKWGIHLGAYYLRHFNVANRFDNNLNFSAAYQSYSPETATSPNTLTNTSINYRQDECNCDIYSKGLFLGLSFRLLPEPKKTIQKEEKVVKEPEYKLQIKAIDKLTKQILPETEIVIKDSKGNSIQKGKTNEQGILLLEKIVPNDYVIEGVLNTIALEPVSVKKSQFIANKTLEKEIVYANSGILLKGKALICNTNEPLVGATVFLKNTQDGSEKTMITDALGEFNFVIQPNFEYSIYGKKENYFSQNEIIKPNQYNRNVELTLNTQFCMEKVDCDKAIKLQNILYDLDKFFLREESKVELNRLVQFMNDNPLVKVELSSHTDSRGSSKYNQNLSQNRANSAVDYLISQGVAKERLKAIGYGESKLLNECSDKVKCSEEQHQMNRRTEMKVICQNKN
jgi:outer membrane protein OmpA-like peptidoglycan-associated protein